MDHTKAAALSDKSSEPPKFRSATLSHRKPTRFHWQAGPAGRKAMAEALELPSIETLSIKGEFLPEGRADFRLQAQLQASVTQSCVITLVPVPATIAEAVTRRFLTEWAEPEAEDYQVTDDDADEPLPELIDIFEVTREALALALPPYPRATDAELGSQTFAAPGVTPMEEEELRPFAGLASLLQRQTDGDRETPAEVAPVSEKARNAPTDSSK